MMLIFLVILLVLITVTAVIAATYLYFRFKQLQTKDLEFSQAFEISREGVYYMNLQTHRTTVNDAYLRLLGYDPDKIDFDPNEWIEFVHPDDREWVMNAYDQVESKSDTYISIRYRLLTKEGEYIWVLDRSKVVAYDKSGEAEKSIGTITQIDQMIKIEDILKGKNEELNEALEKLKNSQARLIEIEKMAALGLMTSGITYELNNPLNYVKGNVYPLRKDFLELKEFLETLLDDPSLSASEVIKSADERIGFRMLFNEIGTLLDGIEAGAGKSSEIIESLQMFSFDRNSEKPMLLNVNEIVNSALRLLHGRLSSNITIHKELGDLEPIVGWPGRLNQSLVSLLCNSIEAIEKGKKGNIYIKTYSKDDGSVIRLEDDGHGVKDRIKEKIFEPFFTTKNNSSGLGLPVVRSIIESHDGKITYIEDKEKTIFELYIPSGAGLM